VLTSSRVTTDRSPTRRPHTRQAGFSLVVVFLIVLVMVGIASAVMLTTQGDLQVSGHERESAVALYAAEAGVAWAQQWAYRLAVPLSNQKAWSGLLQITAGAGSQALCVNAPAATIPPQTPPPNPITFTYVPDGSSGIPQPGQLVTYDALHGGSFLWCIHNNALDPIYTVFQGALQGSCGPSATSPNNCDLDGIATIESWGYGPNGATVHLTVDVSYNNPANTPCAGYIQAGVTERHTGGCHELDPVQLNNQRTF
jgi:type II secretory pathway pseudopilin PulG